ncbi:MAG TPA: hypothetical protein VGC77_10105 [Rhodopseudomonas sp.]|uniref:hypothetical protein n=1 Tax=Rhodopseudomonas sp. TaxID=1078 RepID=UPI002ED8930C
MTTRVFLALLTLALLLIVGLYVSASHLNNDDIVFNTGYFDDLKALPLPQRLWLLLSNGDVGRGQFRTYGLARVIQYLEIEALGRSPLAVYGSIVALQLASAAALYWALTRLVADSLARLLIAVIWFGNPFVLLISHTFHHYLYTVGPFLFLFIWIGLALNRPKTPWVIGAALLNAAWLMGEAAIPSIYLLLLLGIVGAERKRPFLYQLAAVSLLLAAYIVYQRSVLYDPTLSRWTFVAPASFDDAWYRAIHVFDRIFHDGRASVGLDYRDFDMPGGLVAGMEIYSNPLFWGALIALGGVALWLPRQPGRIAATPLIAALLFAASTFSLYFLLYVATGAPPFTLRYMPPVGAVLVVTLVLLLGSLLRRPRLVAALSCVVLLCITTLGLWSLRQSVDADFNDKVGRLIAARQQGKTAVLIYNQLPEIGVPRVSGNYPALGSPYESAVNHPLAVMWTTHYYLWLVLGFQAIGSDYKEIDADSIDLMYGPSAVRVKKSDLVIVGMEPSPYPVYRPNFVWYRDWDEFLKR